MEKVNKIASFTVDHDLLTEGIYVSRIDGDVTTYDLRTRVPNAGDYMDNLTMHSVEHMFATYVRSSRIGERVIYFGPMGCQTGFYLLVRDAENEEVLRVVIDVLNKIINHEGEMFGAVKKECGNYKNLDLSAAKAECKKYLDILLNKENDFMYKGEKI
ncbi:MAG: S-ribosylhomocysteine lyase [Clostridia bacterium]|nr:S-ribosylhomocysteine lyase [Clostridia bacterium]MBO5315323.1 S-ribosylhomocysteine lyase [Clostridia bacterium]